VTAVQLQLLLVLVLNLLNAAFAGSEIALISLRPSQLDRLRDRGKRGATLAKLAEDPNEFLATVQIGITLPGFLASATAAVSLAEPLVPLLSPLGGAAGPVAILLVTLVLTFLTLVAGELAPKRIAMARAEGWALLAARPLQLLATLSRPAVWLLGRSTDILVRLAGVDPRALRDEVGDELREMVLTRSPSPRQAQILEGTFELAERRVRDILVPRPQVTLVDPAADAGAAIAVLQQSGHSRAPLGDDLDRVSGIVHLKDLVGHDGAAAAVARPPLFLPESLPVLDAMRALQGQRRHLAVVVDEHGGGPASCRWRTSSRSSSARSTTSSTVTSPPSPSPRTAPCSLTGRSRSTICPISTSHSRRMPPGRIRPSPDCCSPGSVTFPRRARAWTCLAGVWKPSR